MQKDAELLANLGSKPILHLYEWEGKCLTYGHFSDPLKHLKQSGLDTYGIKTARRPTGGGVIFHLTDYAFSILIPTTYPSFSINTLDNYAYINRKVINAIQAIFPVPLSLLKKESVDCLGFCMAQPTQYDIVMDRKKIGGAAQRRTKKGYLHQGSISLMLPPLDLLQDVLKDESILHAMQTHTYPLLYQPDELSSWRMKLKQELINTILSSD